MKKMIAAVVVVAMAAGAFADSQYSNWTDVGTVSQTADGVQVQLTSNVSRTVRFTDDLGEVVLDLNGFSIVGAASADGISIVHGVGTGTHLKIVDSLQTGAAKVCGGDGNDNSPAGGGGIKVASETEGVTISVYTNVTVRGGRGGIGIRDWQPYGGSGGHGIQGNLQINEGRIAGGNGCDCDSYGVGGIGGSGVVGDVYTNRCEILGGDGGDGDSDCGGDSGGSGGHGIQGSLQINEGSVVGGNGGKGLNYGGSGGHGIQGALQFNEGNVVGGDGGYATYGGIGGDGVHGNLQVNEGRIAGGNGGGSDYTDGGMGGSGVVGDVYINRCEILGGDGGDGDPAGNGGHGVLGNLQVNEGRIIGGKSGGGSSSINERNGGNGVVGVVYTNRCEIMGGAGEDGYFGGNGGHGIQGSLQFNDGSVVGGDGGDGEPAGNGGNGIQGNLHVNEGRIAGGNGGYGDYLNGGIGGSGVVGDVCTNCCEILGGDGGDGEFAGNGGHGVLGNLQVNEGLIAGGNRGDGPCEDVNDGGSGVVGDVCTNCCEILGGRGGGCGIKGNLQLNEGSVRGGDGWGDGDYGGHGIQGNLQVNEGCIAGGDGEFAGNGGHGVLGNLQVNEGRVMGGNGGDGDRDTYGGGSAGRGGSGVVGDVRANCCEILGGDGGDGGVAGDGGHGILGNLRLNEGRIAGGSGGGSDYTDGGMGGSGVSGDVEINCGKITGGDGDDGYLGRYGYMVLGGMGVGGNLTINSGDVYGGSGYACGTAVNGNVATNMGTIVGGFDANNWNCNNIEYGGDGVGGSVSTNGGFILGTCGMEGTGRAVVGNVDKNGGFINDGNVFAPPDIRKAYTGKMQTAATDGLGFCSVVQSESGIDIGEYLAIFRLINTNGLWFVADGRLTQSDVVAKWHIVEADVGTMLSAIFEDMSVGVEFDGVDGWVVTLENDVDSANLPVEIPDNLGNVAIDLKGRDLTGPDGSPAIRIVPSERDGNPIQLTIVNAGEGNASVCGGEGESAIVVSGGARNGVVINIGRGVFVQGGGSDIPAVIGNIGTNEGVFSKVDILPPSIASAVYTGSRQVAAVPASALYSVAQNAGGIDAGSYPVVLRLSDTNNYCWAGASSGPLELAFCIRQATNEWIVAPSIEGWEFGRTPSVPNMGRPRFGTAEVMYGSRGGTLSPLRPSEMGEHVAVFTVAETANYSGLSMSVDFTIVKSIAGATVTLGPALVYNGEEQTQTVTGVNIDGLDATFEVSGNKATDAGTYTLTVTGTGDFTGTATAQFTIAKAEVEPPASVESKVYTGELLTAEISSTDRYSVANGGGVDVGNYPVTLTLTDAANYRWKDGDSEPMELTFTITKATNEWITEPSVVGWTYGDAPSEPNMGTAKFGTATVTYGALGAERPTEAGDYTATFTVVGTDNYAGLTKSLDFTIERKSIEGAAVTLGPALVYSGAEQTQSVTGVNVDGLDATFDVSGNKATEAGTYTLTVTGTGNFIGTTTKQFTIAKAEVESPASVASKVYTGELLTADISSTDLYALVNDGGVDVGNYPVVLTLTDATNYRWKDGDSNPFELTFTITKATNAWITEPSIAGWTYGDTPSAPNMGVAKFGAATVAYGALGAARPTEVGSYVATFTVAETGNYTGLVEEVPFVIASAEETKLQEIFEGLPATVESDDEGGWIVTLTGDISADDLPIEIPDNLGDVTIHLNGHDLVGGEEQPVVIIVPGDGEGEPTQLTIVTSGGAAIVQGGEGAPAIEVADGAQEGVLINIGEGVTVQGGDDYTPAIIGEVGTNEGTIVKPSRIHVPGEGTVTTPKSWNVGQKVTWKAKAAKGSVFAHWEGEFVDSLGLSRNELRNPSLAFTVPKGFDASQITAVFIALDDDGLSNLSFVDGEGKAMGDEGVILFELKADVGEFWLVDDSESYVTASVSGLPSGLKFDAKTMRVTGTTTKSGVYWVQVKAKNASGYQWAEKVKMVVPGYTQEPKEPKLTQTAYYPLTVISSDTVAGTVSGTGVYAEGKKVSISAKPSKGLAFAGWYRDAALTEPMQFASGDYRKASQSVVVPEVRYLFARFVEATTAADPVTGLAAVGSGLTDEGKFSWRVGVAVPEDDGVEYTSASLPSASAANLPAGVKFDAAKGRFTGVPTKAGSYTATVTVKNASKATAMVTLTIEVAALDEWAQGTFNGVVAAVVEGRRKKEVGRSVELATIYEGRSVKERRSVEEVVGLVTFTVDAKGKISGKILEGGKTWSLSAVSFSRVEHVERVGNGLAYYATVVAKSGKEVATNEIAIVAEATGAAAVSSKPPYRGFATGTFELFNPSTFQPFNLQFSAWQNLWKVEPWKTEMKDYAKANPTVVVEIGNGEGESGGFVETALPGTVTLKLAASGAVTAKGEFVVGYDDAKQKNIVYSSSCSTVVIQRGGFIETALPNGGSGETAPSGDYIVYLYFPANEKKGFGGYSGVIWLE